MVAWHESMCAPACHSARICRLLDSRSQASDSAVMRKASSQRIQHAIEKLTDGEDEVGLAEHAHAWNSPLLHRHRSKVRQQTVRHQQLHKPIRQQGCKLIHTCPVMQQLINHMNCAALVIRMSQNHNSEDCQGVANQSQELSSRCTHNEPEPELANAVEPQQRHGVLLILLQQVAEHRGTVIGRSISHDVDRLSGLLLLHSGLPSSSCKAPGVSTVRQA